MTPGIPPIHILGAGISGLTLARCLRNRGIQSIVYEKSPSPAYHNYGISLQPWTCRLLLGVLGIEEGAFVGGVAVDAAKGGRGVLHSERLRGEGGGGGEVLRAHRGRLEGLLREGVDVRWGHALDGFEAEIERSSKYGTGFVLNFKDREGVSVRGGFVVDGLGVHSLVRRSLLPDAGLNVLPYVVFRGTRKIEGRTFKEIYQDALGGGNVVEMKTGDVLLQISVNDYHQDGEGADISCIYSRPARPDDTLHRPGRSTGEAGNISEAFYREVSQLRELKQPFQDAFDEEKVRKGRTLHWLMRDLMVPKEELDGLAKKGVLLIGDSAHALPILGGEGACFAVGDAVKLADAIEKERVDASYGEMYGEWEGAMKKGRETLARMHEGKPASSL
ncbi:uncharacterized protein L3040_009374 [Drepanopeziza brunnea f. sp. 'multigermtubi']|uniref:VrtH n=1 Tax=Marssonina brunnea f. sp. multigermtubi (strain MB_m1) TaxID=1072389 RepID=K1Y241_MARBU|nr:VrtH [Drepanopeziza brunnea f. sp. 'multigermtubi' MB_m1]EKD19184.1 VrtH [Drepanopeziza brunnea f. sp. 'multigermtubi' MB_m1]KAJ5032782.1 hypothetical protein L3040_009374 [Drepanopeziza brunnea f. sp. 'multigermtubi']